jgi:hypothetical protein
LQVRLNPELKQITTPSHSVMSWRMATTSGFG